MRILPKWAMMFSVCIPIIGQFIFLFILSVSYTNLQFIRPETTRSLVKDLLLILLTGGFISIFLIPVFFREVHQGAKRMNVDVPNYSIVSALFVVGGYVMAGFGVIEESFFLGIWFLIPVIFSYLLITPFEQIHEDYAEYM